MNIIPPAVALAVLAIIGSPVSTRAAEDDGVAVAIVYDTSGSMREQVRDNTGKLSPKYLIANRALQDVARRIEAFATNTAAGAPRNVQAGLFIFDGANSKQAIPFGPFKAETFQQWAKQFSSPNGATPLGSALSAAGQAVINSGLPRKHVLVITDGNNTVGPAPAAVMSTLKQRAEAKQSVLSVHFLAFDVDANVFVGVKNLGATVVGAADEAQLNKQLEFILAKKILLEDEEPSQKK